MQRPCFLSACLVVACSLCSSCVGQREAALEEQVHQQDMQLRQLQPAQADTLNQLQAMREEINELKGQLDDLKNVGGAQALVNRVNKHDAALHQVENSMAMDFNLGDPLTVQPKPVIVPKPTQSQPLSIGQYGEPVVAENPQTPQTEAPQAAQAPSAMESNWGKESPRPKAPEPAKDLSLALYDAGLNAYNSRNYAEAQRSFPDFLKNYGTHKLVPDAQYYLAECYFQRNQFSEAALEYNEVITKYPKSSRAPGSYLKQGICFSKSGQKEAAKARMNELIKKYPHSPEAARAKNFLKTNV